MARPGVGGGEWTPKDLLGHLCFWEEKVLEALASWDAGERAPIDREIYAGSIGAINAAGVRARSRHTLARVLRDWDNVHGELIRALRAMSDARWENPATPRGRKSLGHRMGQLLVGRGPFEHDEAHVKSLEGVRRGDPGEQNGREVVALGVHDDGCAVPQERDQPVQRRLGHTDTTGARASTDRGRVVRAVDRELVPARPACGKSWLDAADAERERPVANRRRTARGP